MGAERHHHISSHVAIREVVKQIRYAYEHPLTYEEWKKSIEEIPDLANRIIQARSNPNSAFSHRLSREHDRRFVLFSNPHEFMLAQTCVIEPKLFRNFVHECQHLNMARELGFEGAAIGFYFYQDRGEVKIQYFTNFGKTPENLTDEEIIFAYREIALAPDWLSRGDNKLH